MTRKNKVTADADAAEPTARDIAMQCINKGVVESASAGGKSVGAVNRIAFGVVSLYNASNGYVTLSHDGHDVEFSADNLLAYCAGKLPTKAADASERKMPTNAWFMRAISDMSDDIAAKRTEKAEADKTKGNAARTRNQRDNALIASARLETELNSVATDTRRALAIAGYLICSVNEDNKPVYDVASVTMPDNASRILARDAGADADADASPVVLSDAASYWTEKRGTKSKAKAKKTDKPDTPKTGTVADGDGNALAATLTTEALRKGGAERKGLADALAVIAGMIADIEGGAKDRHERDAVMRIILGCEALLDDEAMLELETKRDNASNA